jgi:hypothetical protein
MTQTRGFVGPALFVLLSMLPSLSWATNQAEFLPQLPDPSSFVHFNPAQPHSPNEWAPLGHARFNLDGPDAERQFGEFLNSNLGTALNPRYFSPVLPPGASFSERLLVWGTGSQIAISFAAAVPSQGCPLINPVIPAAVRGSAQISRLGEGPSARLYGRVSCDRGYRIRLDLAHSSSALTANASALVLDVCLRSSAGDGSVAVDLYSSLVIGPDWGTRCAGANIHRLLSLQTTPLVSALHRAFLRVRPTMSPAMSATMRPTMGPTLVATQVANARSSATAGVSRKSLPSFRGRPL